MIHMLKTLDVVAAIIERDGHILLAQRPPHADARPECYIASHLREVSARLIHLHAWWVPHFHGEPIARYHSQLRWCSPQEAFTFNLAPADIPLLEAFIARRAALPSR